MSEKNIHTSWIEWKRHTLHGLSEKKQSWNNEQRPENCKMETKPTFLTLPKILWWTNPFGRVPLFQNTMGVNRNIYQKIRFFADSQDNKATNRRFGKKAL